MYSNLFIFEDFEEWHGMPSFGNFSKELWSCFIVCPLTYDKHLGSFHFFEIMNRSTINVPVQVVTILLILYHIHVLYRTYATDIKKGFYEVIVFIINFTF